MTRAAMLAALIVGIAMQTAAAEPFYREDLRIPMERPRAGFSDYLSASPHRAFAVSPKGAFAFRGARRSAREAAEAALAACAEYAANCADDHLAETANAGSC